MKKLLAAAVLSGVAFASTASAQEFKSTPDNLVDIARGYGSADLELTDDGKPRISGRIEGTKYGVFLYGCEDAGGCKTVQFSAGWELDQPAQASRINEWNKDYRFGKAYIDDDGDVILEMNVNLAFGLSRDNFDDTFDWWAVVVKQFKEFYF